MKTTNKVITEKIVNFLLNILLVIFGFVLLISIYTGVQTRVLKKEYSDFFGYSIFEVQTGSMAKTINAGDWILVKLTDDVGLNDIVTYKYGEEFITHRIIEVYNGTYVTKGDANSSKDKPISSDQIIGKVVKTVGGFGILRKTIFSPSVLIAIIVTLFLFSLAFKKKKDESFLKLITNKIKSMFQKNKNEFKELEKEKPTLEIKKVEEVKGETKEDETLQEELEKTSYYRMISVDGEKEEDNEEDEECSEEELDKTSHFRMIMVDEDETNETLLEIAENEIKKSGKEEKIVKPEVVEEAPIELEEETLTDIDLKFLKKKNKKVKNVIENALLVKREELNELFDILLDEKIVRQNLKEEFIEKYINIKYYNIDEIYGKSSATKVRKYIKDFSEKLISSYKGKDKNYPDMIKAYDDAFELIICLDIAKNSISDSRAKTEFYKEAINSVYPNMETSKKNEVISEMLKVQKTAKNTLEYFLQTLDTNMFKLMYNKVIGESNMFALDLDHNVEFSKVYSDYIIDKTYTEGIVAEDKMYVMITLLSVQLIKDMMASNYNKRYFIHIPDSIYEKNKKLDKLLKMLDDAFAKNSVYILVKYNELLSNKKIIKEIRQEGYKFAVMFDENYELLAKDKGNLFITNYIFIDKIIGDKDKIVSFVPEELKSHVIIDDIIQKTGGSE